MFQRLKSHNKSNMLQNAISLKVSLYILGFTSTIASVTMTIYEINDKIFLHSAIIPDKSFVFSIACIIFSLSLIVGVHRERLDYVTPYFMTSVTLIGYFVTVVLLDISKWNNVLHPKSTLVYSIFGLFLTTSSTMVLFKFMEKLKHELRSHHDERAPLTEMDNRISP